MRQASRPLDISRNKALSEEESDANPLCSFQRHVRCIPVDVWVAEKPVTVGYQTTEIFFSRHDWNILVEEVNAHQELPLGMAVYRANFVSRQALYLVLTKITATRTLICTSYGMG